MMMMIGDEEKTKLEIDHHWKKKMVHIEQQQQIYPHKHYSLFSVYQQPFFSPEFSDV